MLSGMLTMKVDDKQDSSEGRGRFVSVGSDQNYLEENGQEVSAILVVKHKEGSDLCNNEKRTDTSGVGALRKTNQKVLGSYCIEKQGRDRGHVSL